MLALHYGVVISEEFRMRTEALHTIYWVSDTNVENAKEAHVQYGGMKCASFE